jgi:leucyl-tRNA synthetase
LLYARFWHQVLFDLGHVPCQEPFRKLFHQGLIMSHAYQRADKSLVPVDEVEEVAGGTHIERATGAAVTQIVAKMSKSLRNVVSADDPVAEFGADTFRLYEMYMGPLEASKPWNTRDISGLLRFLQRTWRLLIDEETGALKLRAEPDPKVEKELHRAIAKVGADIERLAFNTAIASLIKLVNEATASGVTADQAKRIACILAPLAPHVAEEVWEKLGEKQSVALASWPSYDEAMLRDDEVEMPIAVQGKVRAKIMVPTGSDAAAIEKLALADPKVQELTGGKPIKKLIVVPGKMVNLVLG